MALTQILLHNWGQEQGFWLHEAPGVPKKDSAIHWINLNTYLLHSGLSAG